MKLNVAPDKSKAEALLKMAKITLERLHEFNEEKYPSNTLVDYYDVIHKLCDALSCLEGIKFTGEGAHQQLLDHVCKKNLDEGKRVFLQDMRDFRNRIQYEGFFVNPNYITSHSKKINTIIKQLATAAKTLSTKD